MEMPNNTQRPVLVATRDEVIPALNNVVVVAPVTSTVREIPTCIAAGPDEGIDHDSVASFDNLAAVPKSVLTTRVGSLGLTGRQQICDALTAMTAACFGTTNRVPPPPHPSAGRTQNIAGDRIGCSASVGCGPTAEV
jgi:mRNA interferase MazF